MADINKHVVKFGDQSMSVAEIHARLVEERKIGTRADLEDILRQVIEQSQKICGTYQIVETGFQCVVKSPDELKLALIAAYKLNLLASESKTIENMWDGMMENIMNEGEWHDCRVYYHVQQEEFGWDNFDDQCHPYLPERPIAELFDALQLGLAHWDEMRDNTASKHNGATQ